MIKIARLDTSAADFWAQLEQRLAWEETSDEAVTLTVRDILTQVRARGDAAVLEYTHRYDRLRADSMAELEIPAERLRQALHNLPADQRLVVKLADHGCVS